MSEDKEKLKTYTGEQLDSHGEHHVNNRTKHKKHKKNKVERYIKKHRLIIINLLTLLMAIILLAFITTLISRSLYLKNSTDGDQPSHNEDVFDDNDIGPAVGVALPHYTDEFRLVGNAVVASLNAEAGVPISEVLERYRESGVRLDTGMPVTLSFKITEIPEGYSHVSSTIELCEDSSFINARVYNLNSNERSVTVWHLKTNTLYYYRVNLRLSDGSITSVQSTFRTANTARMLSIDGAVNVRDIGGWKTLDGRVVKQGLLFRGSELDGAVEPAYSITQSGISDMLTVLGVKTDMDLRSPADNKYGTDALGANVKHTYYPIIMYEGIFATECNAYVRQIFSDLSNKEMYPVYMHCTYGADRTGTVCYLLEAVLGLSENDLMREYELSALYHEGLNVSMMNKFVSVLKKRPGDTMQEKAEGYLLSIGVTETEIASIKSIFLD